jgi:hypothetical protein
MTVESLICGVIENFGFIAVVVGVTVAVARAAPLVPSAPRHVPCLGHPLFEGRWPVIYQPGPAAQVCDARIPRSL